MSGAGWKVFESKTESGAVAAAWRTQPRIHAFSRVSATSLISAVPCSAWKSTKCEPRFASTAPNLQRKSNASTPTATPAVAQRFRAVGSTRRRYSM